jgi:hypothetical protein
MQMRTILMSGALSIALGVFGGAVCAQSAGTMEDAVTKADEAAEAEAQAAEAVAEGEVKKMKEETAIETEAVRGEPMQEVEVQGKD